MTSEPIHSLFLEEMEAQLAEGESIELEIDVFWTVTYRRDGNPLGMRCPTVGLRSNATPEAITEKAARLLEALRQAHWIRTVEV